MTHKASLRLALLAACWISGTALAADLKPIGTIDVPGQPLKAFDISVIDQADGRYYLADRSNKAIDIFDSNTDRYVGRVGSFVGVVMKDGKVDNDISGPDGVMFTGTEIWAGDGDSTVKVIDPATRKTTATISTGGQTRLDEMAYDPKDQVFVGVNNAEDPPFATVISTKADHAVEAGAAAAGFDPPAGVTKAADAAAAKLEPKQGDYVAPNFKFQSGEIMPELKLHYTTLGTPRTDASGRVTNAVLALHGTTGTGQNFLMPSLADFLFGSGQPLDAGAYYIIMPDGIGRGGSSKPSDGLHARFPHYGYVDLVEAQHTLLVDGLHIDHLRLVLGTSMGGMHAWLWGERYPTMMDAIMPVASQPVAVTGRNYLWRDLIMQSIRNDPDYHNGEYTTQPTHYETVLPLFTIMTGSPRILETAATTQTSANAYFDKIVAEARKTVDANDYLYWFQAVSDYDPEMELEKIVAPVFAVNFADDLLNPAQLGVVARVMPRVVKGRFVIIPEGPETIGHQTLTRAKLWAPYLSKLMEQP